MNTFMKRYFPDKNFLKPVLAVAIPMTTSNFIMSAVNTVDTVMIGSLGSVSVAAVSVANQIFFIFSVLLFGIYSGAAVFLAQFWGKGDIPNIRRTMGYMLVPGLLAALVFTLAAELFPEFLIGLYSNDPAVIEEGAIYLRIIGTSYIVNAVAFAYAFTCRSSGQVKLPMVASIIAVLTNVTFNYILIFGKFGFPRMEVAGAAVATVISRVLEVFIILIAVYANRLPAAATPRQMLRFDKAFTKRFFKTCAPVIANEGLWSLGTTQYTVIYGLLGTTALASMQIVSSIFNLFMVFGRSFSNAASVLIGNLIGAEDEEGAKNYANKFMTLLPMIGVVMMGLFLLFRPLLLSLFNITPEEYMVAWDLSFMHAITMVPKYFNSLIIVGICRSGGDTLYSAILDVAPVWLVSIPLGYLGANMGLSIGLVFLLINAEEVVKLIFGLPRVFSGKWVHNVVASISDG